MDTKSKKLKYTYGMKAAAAVVLVALIICAVSTAGIFAKNVAFYGGTDYLTADSTTDIFSTVPFFEQVTSDIYLLKYAPELYTYEKHLDSLETKEDALKRAEKAYNGFWSEYDAYKSNSLADENRDEAFAASTEEAVTGYYDSGNGEVYVGQIDGDYEYYVKAFDYPSVNDFLKTFSVKYDEYIAAEKRSFNNTQTSRQQKIDSLVNLKYIIVDTATGKTVSNIENAEELVKNGKAAQLVTEKEWHLYYSAASGAVSYSSQRDFSLFGEESYYSMNRILSSAEDGFARNGYDLYVYIQSPLVEGDDYYLIGQDMTGERQNAITLAVECVFVCVLALAVVIYLFLVCGHKNGVEGYSMAVIDKIPNEIHLLLSGGIIWLLGCLAMALTDKFYNNTMSYEEYNWLIVAIACFVSAAAIVLVEWLMSVARHIKCKKSWIKNTLTFIVVKWLLVKIVIPLTKKIFKVFKDMFNGTVRLLFPKFKNIKKKFFWRITTFVIIEVIFLLLTFVLLNNGNPLLALLFFLFVAAYASIFFLMIWKHLIALDTIIESSRATREGLFKPIPYIEEMPEPIKTLAKNLQYVQDGMEKAVSEAVKGARMKAELITNVSHDLKTPLTSIINYVDLLKKSDIDDIEAQKYIDVLSDKSNRLKRLIEDLVEASKASTGNVVLNKMPVNLYELSVQAIGESEDDFTAKNLEIKLNEVENPVTVFADSQKTWRVIDNLLSNARKYSAPSTRVYVNVSSDKDFGYFTIKNVSSQELDISPEELTQRFVRGDESRTSEGSGLGLSIAKDLCALQGGELSLSIDGDLFKATVKLPLSTQPVIEAVQAEDLSQGENIQ